MNFTGDKINFLDQEPSNYRGILPTKTEKEPTNVTYEEAIKINRHLDDELNGSDPENFVKEFVPNELDEFKNWDKIIIQFENYLKQLSKDTPDSFFNAVVWGTYFKLKGKELSFQGDLQECFGTVFLNKIYDIKDDLMVDNVLENFERKCHFLNKILFEKNLFLRVYELRKKLKYLFKNGHEKNELLKEISSCVEQCFNGFHIIYHELDKK